MKRLKAILAITLLVLIVVFSFSTYVPLVSKNLENTSSLKYYFSDSIPGIYFKNGEGYYTENHIQLMNFIPLNLQREVEISSHNFWNPPHSSLSTPTDAIDQAKYYLQHDRFAYFNGYTPETHIPFRIYKPSASSSYWIVAFTDHQATQNGKLQAAHAWDVWLIVMSPLDGSLLCSFPTYID